MFGLGLCVWGRKSAILITLYQRYILSTRLTIDLNLDQLGVVVFVRFLPLPFPYSILWKEVTLRSPYKEWELCSTSLRAACLYKLFRIPLQWEIVLFPLFIYSVIHLCHYGYIFYSFGYNPIHLYLLCCSKCFNFGLWELFPLNLHIFYLIVFKQVWYIFKRHQDISYIRISLLPWHKIEVNKIFKWAIFCVCTTFSVITSNTV